MPASACSEVDDAASWLLAGIGAAFKAIRGSSHSSAGSDRGGLRGGTSSRHGTFLPRVFSKAVPTIVSDMHGRTTGLEEPVPITMIGKTSRDLESYEKKFSLQNAAASASRCEFASRAQFLSYFFRRCGSRRWAGRSSLRLDVGIEDPHPSTSWTRIPRMNCWCSGCDLIGVVRGLGIEKQVQSHVKIAIADGPLQAPD